MIPQINIAETGKQIKNIMTRCGLKVVDVQSKCGFSTPQAVYKWINGTNLPTVDNLVILADMFDVMIEDILVIEKEME